MMVRVSSALVLACVFASNSFADIDRLPGAYSASFDTGSCTLRLNEPATVPEFSLVKAEIISGFAVGFPNCAHGLDRAAIWQADANGETLTLINAAGETIFTGALNDERAYVGQSASGAAISIRKS